MSPAASPINLQQERRTHSLQAGSVAGTVADAAAATVEPQAVFNIRRYRPSDHPQVVEICRNVYGGTDVLPDRITGEAARPDTNVLVAAASADDTVAALLCCQQRGDVLWLYGARTREDMRRRGLAELLLVGRCAPAPLGGTAQVASGPLNACGGPGGPSSAVPARAAQSRVQTAQICS